MRNTKLHKALIVTLILLAFLIITWKAITAYESESILFYLFFVVLFAHILYGAFKVVDIFGMDFKLTGILLYGTMTLLILLIAFFYPNLTMQFTLLSLFFILTVCNYYRLIKKTKNTAYKKYALEKIKIEAGGIILFLAVAVILYLSSLEFILGIALFFGQLLWIFWMFFVKKVYSIKNQ